MGAEKFCINKERVRIVIIQTVNRFSNPRYKYDWESRGPVKKKFKNFSYWEIRGRRDTVRPPLPPLLKSVPRNLKCATKF